MLEFRLTMKRSIIGIAKPVYVLWYVCCKAMYLFVVLLLCVMFYVVFYVLLDYLFHLPKTYKKEQLLYECLHQSLEFMEVLLYILDNGITRENFT